jgi:hypothetical protein
MVQEMFQRKMDEQIVEQMKKEEGQAESGDSTGATVDSNGFIISKQNAQLKGALDHIEVLTWFMHACLMKSRTQFLICSFFSTS